VSLRRVVVTGLGALTPVGNGLEGYWNGLLAGVSGAGPITRFDASKFKTRFACEVKNFNPEDYFDRKEVRKYDMYTHYGLISSDEAIRDAGFDMSALDLQRVGVIWASGIGGLDTFLTEVANYVKGDGTPRFNPFFIPKMIADITSGHISIKYGFMGPNFATVSACASSANALADAFNYIRYGKAEAFITGGSEAAIGPAGVGGFNAMHALSTRNEDPATASRPFDKDRDGFVIGEGAGILILEEMEFAKARGAKILAEIVGYGMSADAYHITGIAPEGAGAQRSMRAALKDAGIRPEEVGYINAHATSTPAGDGNESQAIEAVFGEHALSHKLQVSGTKSMTGHLLGGAGGLEAGITVLALQNQMLPPTINLDNVDPECHLSYVPNKAIPLSFDIAMSNSFGFGGINASLIMRRWTE
jgi:3-oxoacyl-[acyl-carrier-protein] synthase II